MGAPCYPATSGLTPSCTGAAATCTLMNYLNRTRMDSLSAYLLKYKQLVRAAGVPLENRGARGLRTPRARFVLWCALEAVRV